MSSEANHVPFGEGSGVAGFEMLTYGNRQATSGISPNTATQPNKVPRTKKAGRNPKKKFRRSSFLLFSWLP